MPATTKPSVRKSNGNPAPTTNTSAPTAATSVPVDTINFDDAVEQGKKIRADILAKIDEVERGHWLLGDLADKVETRYDDRTLAKLAQKIEISSSCLKRYRDVYRAWKDISAPARQLGSYSVRKEIATHPDKEQIIRDNPNMTKREAQGLMRRYRRAKEAKEAEVKVTAQEAEWLRHDKKLFKDLVTLANDATRAAEFAYECTTDEQWRRFLKAIEPAQLMYVRLGGTMLVKLVALVEALLEQPETVDLADFVAQWNQAESERHAKAHANTQEAPTVQAS
jgi:hypothetical protein